MDEIRQALIKGEGGKLTKKEYKFAVEIEKGRLKQQLVFLTLVSFFVGVILFLSLYFDIKGVGTTSTDATTTTTVGDVTAAEVSGATVDGTSTDAATTTTVGDVTAAEVSGATPETTVTDTTSATTVTDTTSATTNTDTTPEANASA